MPIPCFFVEKERVEDFLGSFRGYARTGVRNQHFGELPILRCLHADSFLSLSRVGCRVQRIHDQIGKDLLQLNRIAIDPKRRSIQFASQ